MRAHRSRLAPQIREDLLLLGFWGASAVSAITLAVVSYAPDRPWWVTALFTVPFVLGPPALYLAGIPQRLYRKIRPRKR